MPQHADAMNNPSVSPSGSRQTDLVNAFSTLPTWVIETEFRTFDLVASAFSH